MLGMILSVAALVPARQWEMTRIFPSCARSLTLNLISVGLTYQMSEGCAEAPFEPSEPPTKIWLKLGPRSSKLLPVTVTNSPGATVSGLIDVMVGGNWPMGPAMSFRTATWYCVVAQIS